MQIAGKLPARFTADKMKRTTLIIKILEHDDGTLTLEVVNPRDYSVTELTQCAEEILSHVPPEVREIFQTATPPRPEEMRE